ncbi:hypothetical protein QE152_g20829 [Popillia japonica]|uniref:Uncharacterized protein n=1 Tax=Popillia japonica TaxID=7064 RepID=A0AAW1KQ19_POPJA
MHRICKTKLPSTIQVLKPKINENVIEKLQLRQEQNTKYYNRSFKNLPTLNPNLNVIIRDPVSNQWNPGKVIEQANKPRSYNVLNDRRHTIQRNRKHLKLSLNQPTIKEEESFECLNPSSNGANRNTINMSLENINDPPLRHQPITTRCGRLVKLPSKFKDYEL